MLFVVRAFALPYPSDCGQIKIKTSAQRARNCGKPEEQVSVLLAARLVLSAVSS